jgi:hypothetical protein
MTAVDWYGRLLEYCGRHHWGDRDDWQGSTGRPGRTLYQHQTRSVIFFGSTIAAQAALSSASVVSAEDQSSSSRARIDEIDAPAGICGKCVKPPVV